MSAPGIAKAGWLYREFLRRWKKHWFVLYTDGMLRYYESPDNYTPEGAVILKFECVEVLSGKESRADSTPEGKDRNSLFSLVFRSQDLWHLCAENFDDMRAWTWAINDMRQGQGGPQSAATYPTQPPVPYPPVPYPPQNVVYTSPTVHVVPAVAPQTIVLGPRYVHYPYNYSSGIDLSFGPTIGSPGAVLRTNGTAPTYPYTTTHTTYW